MGQLPVVSSGAVQAKVDENVPICTIQVGMDFLSFTSRRILTDTSSRMTILESVVVLRPSAR